MNHAGRLFFYRNPVLVRDSFLLIVGEEDNEVLTIEFTHGTEQGFMKHYMRKHMDPWFNDHPGWIEVGWIVIPAPVVNVAEISPT